MHETGYNSELPEGEWITWEAHGRLDIIFNADEKKGAVNIILDRRTYYAVNVARQFAVHQMCHPITVKKPSWHISCAEGFTRARKVHFVYFVYRNVRSHMSYSADVIQAMYY